MSDFRNTIPLTLSFGLELKEEEKQKVLSLMRLQSSSIRVAHNMLKEGKNSQEIYHRIRSLFPSLPTRYIPSAIIKASQYPKDKTVIFGGKTLFEKLCKNHLQGKKRQKLKEEWREKRQGILISVGVGNEQEKGNRLLRFVDTDGRLFLRITRGYTEPHRDWTH